MASLCVPGFGSHQIYPFYKDTNHWIKAPLILIKSDHICSGHFFQEGQSHIEALRLGLRCINFGKMRFSTWQAGRALLPGGLRFEWPESVTTSALLSCVSFQHLWKYIYFLSSPQRGSDEYLLRAQCARIMPNTEGNMALASRDLKSSGEGKLSK